jgi:transcriptional regulator with XRE-family HTH domain
MELEKDGNIIRQTCKELGFTQKDLAVYFGVTQKAVSDWATQKYKLPKNFNLIINLIKADRDCSALRRSLKISLTS